MEHHLKRKAAFTLAEVLITLGIIGVVAALTMPTLISNHQKKVLVTQLKKVVNMLNNNFQHVCAMEGVDLISQTPLSSGRVSDEGYVYIDIEAFKNHFGLKEIELEQGYPISYVNAALATKNGAIIIFDQAYNDFTIYVDVNGYNPPNKGGRDIFYMYIHNKKGIVSTNLYTDNVRDNCVRFVNSKGNTLVEKRLINYTAARNCYTTIIHDGFEMNY